jgi:hypothetical protein
MAIVLALVCAAVAACCFAGAATLQHGAVRACAAGHSLGLRAFRQMVQSRRWLAGTGLAVTGSGLHVTALTKAPLVIVQPVGVLSLVLTVLLGTRIRRVAVTPGVRAAVTCVCAGTGGFVVLAALAGTGAAGMVRPGPVALVVAGAAVLTMIGLRVRGRTRCLVLAAAAAVLFGTGSALIRMASLAFAESGVAAAGLAVLAALVMVAGGWVQHQAYASGPPAVVIGATTVIDPVTAIAIGIGVFGEAARISPVSAAVQGGLALLAGVAVIVLARSVSDPHLAEPSGPSAIRTCRAGSRRRAAGR